MSKKKKEYNQEKAQQKTESEVYNSIACGTFVNSLGRLFFDYLYSLFPELSKDLVNVSVRADYEPRTKEQIDVILKEKSGEYCLFTPENIISSGIKKISNDLEKELDVFRKSEEGKNSKADMILRMERTGSHTAIVNLYYIQREVSNED